MKKEKDISLFVRIIRPVRFRLVVPLKRSVQDPVVLARGVLVGMMWAFTPLVGIQMTTVFLTWIVAKKCFKWHFSLPIAIAFTWVTNVFTMIPVYYVFYVTGKIMMGDWTNITGWNKVKTITQETFMGDYSAWESVSLFFKMLLQDWGLAMALGCLPWAVILGWLSYRWSLKFITKWQEKRSHAQEKRHYWRQKLVSATQSIIHPHIPQILHRKKHKKKRKKRHGKKFHFGSKRHRSRIF